jgi:hypothetical protein
MKIKSLRTVLTSLLVIVISLLPSSFENVQAASAARANQTTAGISSATFIAYATTSPTGANPNGSQLTLLNKTASQYFYIRNTGTVTISAITLNVSYTQVPAKTSFYHCALGVAFISLNTCASGIRASITGSGIVIITLPPNSWFALELDPKRLTTPSISVSISSSQIRSPLSLNS